MRINETKGECWPMKIEDLKDAFEKYAIFITNNLRIG